MKKRSQKQLAFSLRLPLAVATLMALSAEAADIVEGIGLRESTQLGGYRRLSMMGGARMMLKVDGGLNAEAGANYLQYTNNQIGAINDRDGESVTLRAPALSNDDEFSSMPADGKLAFSTPSVMTLFNAQFDDFNGAGILPNGNPNDNQAIAFKVSAQNSRNEGYKVACTSDNHWKCDLKYARKYTPQLYDVVPNQMYKGQPVDWWINIQAAMSEARDGHLPMEELSIDGTLNYWEETIDSTTRLKGWNADTLHTFNGDQKPNKYGVPRARFTVGDSMIMKTAQHCNFVGDDCWNVRTHAKIDSVSANSGSTNGGQELTITGWGFENSVDVTVAGVPCEVISNTMEQIKCTTGAASQASADGVAQVGQPGIARRKYGPENSNKHVSYDKMNNGNLPLVEESLQLVFEMPTDLSSKAGWAYDGYFKAPETGEYRFYLACDDECQLRLDSINPLSSGIASDPQQIAYRNYHSSWRDYLEDPIMNHHQYISDWIPLTKDEMYKINANHLQYGGAAHFTASVEFKRALQSAHPNAAKEIQMLKIDMDNVAETWEVIITDPSNGQYRLRFQDPNSLDLEKVSTEDVIKADDSADTFKKRIEKPYYNDRVKSSTTVTLTHYDANGLETNDPAQIKTAKYTVKVNKRITGQSFANIEVIKDPSNTSTITIVKPTDTEGSLSSAPLSGKFIVNCPDPANMQVIGQTREINFDESQQSMQNIITQDIPYLADKLRVKSLNSIEQPYWENQRNFMFVFTEMEVDVPQCYLTSGMQTPLTGANISLTSSTKVDFGGNLMFEPIPMEMLYSAATKPQILVNVDRVPAACANLNCDYLYQESSATVTGQSLMNNQLTLTGTNLPLEISDVRLGDRGCGPMIGVSDTEIICTLTGNPTAGTHLKAEIVHSEGVVAVSGSVPSISVPLTTSGITPATDLNQNGGDIIVISGSGFPVDTQHAEVTFSDNTKCNVLETGDTYIKCMTNGFDQSTIDTSSPYGVTVEVTAVSAVTDSSQNVQLSIYSKMAMGVSPNTLSPVLKQEITVTMSENFPDINPADYTAELRGKTDIQYTRSIKIVSWDDSTKEMNLKFNGAPSGDYTLVIRGPDGNIGGNALDLTTIIAVDNISPSQGSVLGGTLLTITGAHFGLEATDNPVKVGDNYCIVESISDGEIKCRILIDGSQQVATAEVIVFAKTSEEMVCNIDSMQGCIFEYKTSTTTVSRISDSFDAASNSIHLTVDGTGFLAGDIANTELWIDGQRQETIDVQPSSATFRLVNSNSISSSDIKFYTAEGLPQGSFTSHTFIPALISVSPSTGSSGGTLFTVQGVGFGMYDAESINLKHTLTGQNICSQVTSVSYGTFTCQTIALEITSADEILLSTAQGDFGCANTVSPSQCKITQEKASSPTLTNASITMSGILFDGNNFPTGQQEITCEFKGVTGTGVPTGSSVQCSFLAGVPAENNASAPLLYFKNTMSQVILTADTNGITLANPLEVGTPLSGLECSFAGGCTYKVAGNGIAGALQGNPANSITICGNTCMLDMYNSSMYEAACTLPALATTYSANTYDIVQTKDIQVSWAGTGSELEKLNDGVNTKDAADNTKLDCFAEATARDGYTFSLDEAKIFLNNLLDKAPYVGGNLKLQGSNDGTSFVDIHAYDESIHEGWNTLDWRAAPQVFRTIRLQGAVAGSCRLGEVTLIGVEVLNNSNTAVTCIAKLSIDGAEQDLTEVIYNGAITPVLDSGSGVLPRYGSVLGDETVTFSGTGFTGTATVTIDKLPCVVTDQSTSSITCTTADKPYVPGEPKLEIYINEVGLVATRGLVYRYVSRWSETATWGGDIPPLENEAVEIPSGRHLLVDVNVPKLSFVVVYGSLIFEPNVSDHSDHKTFDAGYIMVNGGYLEVGTEEYPYTSRLTITMHGSEADPYIPTYGNKVLAVRYGQLEMHGMPRSHVWTDLKVTAPKNAQSITLNDMNGTTIDWQIGEDIVIASTDYEGEHAEQRTITGISNQSTNPVITFDEPLLYQHFADTQTFGQDTIEMRAEVGLLSRNVVYRGDPQTSSTNQYGAHIMLHSPGDESVIGRIENCEFTDVGQAFKLGRYPIHFHMIGTVQKSYIKKNSIHQTYNRATTLHGVHYLEISGNVAYKTMGHTIFIEDAVETKNLIENNLVVDTRASNSLLNTDQTPACFWITHPDNIFRGNHAAGSARYGYWFDLQETSTGPSFDPNICPENSKLGEFSDNVAHSVGRYGLRIFHNLVPRKYPCKPLVVDLNNSNDPYHQNPVIPARFHRLTSYMNGRNGAIAERMGAVEFHDFKVADNKLAGIEMSLTSDLIDGYAKIVGGVLVGKSAASGSELDESSPHGIIGPRTEGFTIDGAQFYNYNWNDAAALGDCSHCFHSASTDSGARTITTRNLEFDAVTRRIKYQYPQRGIFHDEDGTLTGTANSFATKGFLHVQQPECTLDETLYDGVICDDSVQVRRVAFHGYKPNHFRGQEMNILRYDDSDMTAEAKQDYKDDADNYAHIFWKDPQLPSKAWAVPFVTGHTYRVTWANDLDFTEMKVQISERWEAGDKEALFVLPFVDAREAINVTRVDTGQQIPDKSLLESRNTWESGHNWLQNATEIREFTLAVNGKNPDIHELKLQGLQCISGVCPQEEVEVIPINDDQSLWSQDSSWPSGQKPQAGQDVHIEPGMNIVLDEETPVLNLVTINGRLSFLDNVDPVILRAKQVYVRAGELLIGSMNEPYQANAEIILYGERQEATQVMSGSVETGNKLLLNTGLVSLHGKPRSRHSRMKMSVYNGLNEALVEPDLDWVAGDQLYFAPTNHQWTHSEYKTILAYNSATGQVTLNSAFEFYHFGQESSTSADFNGVDTRGEVRLLTRNVKVLGFDDSDNWGGNILTMDRTEFDGSVRLATTELDSVEIAKCSQENTFHAAIRFESTGDASRQSYVSNSVVHGSQAWSLYMASSKNIRIESSDFIGAKAVGVNLRSISNVSLDDIFIGDVSKRVWTAGDSRIDLEACVAFCSYWEPNNCYESGITNSIATGCAYAGFVAPGHECGETNSNKFRSNVAHSNERVGALIYPDPASSKSSSCYEGSNFAAYKNREGGLGTHYKTEDLRMRDMTFIDNQMGVCLQTAGESELAKIQMTNVQIYGEDNNQDAPEGQGGYCPDKFGLMLFGSNQGGKDLHPIKESALPVHKIKSYGAWGGQVFLQNVNFHNFQSEKTNKCGKRHTMIQRNPTSSDYIPMHVFVSTTFDNVSDAAVIYLEDPDQKWANPTDCGEWPCTAPENVVLQFMNTKYAGTSRPVRTTSSFQIVSDVESAVAAYSNCEIRTNWSAAWCSNRNLGVLLFESLDADTEDRSVQPVRVTNEATGYANVVNSMMDHVWDGFYTGQKRLSRFPVQIETIGDYTVDFTGTPASEMRFILKADQGGIKIKIPYPNAGSYSVSANGEYKEYTPWDKDQGRHGDLPKQSCGENRYVGVENFLEFYITTKCEIKIVPRDSIMISVRLDWTLDEFYASGGVTSFTDRMAAVLGVHASQIKTVAVYQGSVIVEYLVEALEDDEDSAATLNTVKQNFAEAVASDSLDLGAPVIDAVSGGSPIKTGYDGDHNGGESGFGGNLWDDLIRDEDENNNSGNTEITNNDESFTEDNDESSTDDNDESSTDDNSNSSNDSDQDDNGESGNGETSIDDSTDTDTQVIKITEENVIVETINEPAMTDTVKYLIVFVVVLSAVAIALVVYIAMRMCKKTQDIVVKRRESLDTSQPKQEAQFVVQPDAALDVFRSSGPPSARQNARKGYQEETMRKLKIDQSPIQNSYH